MLPSGRPVALPLALSCALVGALSAQAQSLPESLTVAQVAAPSLTETVVTAQRIAQPITDVLADVTVLGEAQIRASGAVNVADLLARQPGLELSRSGGPGTSTSLFLRGADNRFTAVYIDGVRVDSQAGDGGAPWPAISLDQVERVEILRGPAAAVYGSDAVAGVIQIFTRTGDGPFTPYVGIGVGNRRTGKLEAGFSGKSGTVDYALGAARDLSRGFNAMPAGTPDRDGYRQSSVSGRLGWQVNRDQRLELNATHTTMDAQYDGFMPGLDDHALTRLDTLGAVWSAQWTPRYSTRLSVGQSTQRSDMPTSPPPSKTRLRNILLQNDWRDGAHHVSFNLERRQDQLVYGALDDTRHQNAVALGYGYSAGAHSLQVNLRHDRDSEFGSQTTGGVAYGYGFAPGWRATAAVGTAFRVPTLYQRFSEYGQAGLQPEKSRNIEFGLHWTHGDSRAGVTVWRNRVRDLIDFGGPGACASPFGCYENTGRAVLEGVTLSGAHRVAGVNLSGSLDLQRPRNANTGQILQRRARRIVKLAADTRVADWTLGAEWQASSSRRDLDYDVFPAADVTLAGYGMLNLYASTTVAREWELYGRIDNLADRRHQLAYGYATPGRTLFVGLRWTPRR